MNGGWIVLRFWVFWGPWVRVRRWKWNRDDAAGVLCWRCERCVIIDPSASQFPLFFMPPLFPFNLIYFSKT